MACPAASYAVHTCPFLSHLAQQHGETFARNIATDPTRPAAGSGFQPPSKPEELLRTFEVFHSPEGVVPLSGYDHKVANLLVTKPSGCPYHHQGTEEGLTTMSAQAVVPGDKHQQASTAALPLASMSMSFGGGVSSSLGKCGLAREEGGRLWAEREQTGGGDAVVVHHRLGFDEG